MVFVSSNFADPPSFVLSASLRISDDGDLWVSCSVSVPSVREGDISCFTVREDDRVDHLKVVLLLEGRDKSEESHECFVRWGSVEVEALSGEVVVDAVGGSQSLAVLVHSLAVVCLAHGCSPSEEGGSSLLVAQLGRSAFEEREEASFRVAHPAISKTLPVISVLQSPSGSCAVSHRRNMVDEAVDLEGEAHPSSEGGEVH